MLGTRWRENSGGVIAVKMVDLLSSMLRLLVISHMTAAIDDATGTATPISTGFMSTSATQLTQREQAFFWFGCDMPRPVRRDTGASGKAGFLELITKGNR